MRLTFGDMTKEVSVFHLGKQPRDLGNESFEVNLIEGLTSEHDMEVVLAQRHSTLVLMMINSCSYVY